MRGFDAFEPRSKKRSCNCASEEQDEQKVDRWKHAEVVSPENY